jgi:hypothetical protein
MSGIDLLINCPAQRAEGTAPEPQWTRQSSRRAPCWQGCPARGATRPSEFNTEDWLPPPLALERLPDPRGSGVAELWGRTEQDRLRTCSRRLIGSLRNALKMLIVLQSELASCSRDFASREGAYGGSADVTGLNAPKVHNRPLLLDAPGPADPPRCANVARPTTAGKWPNPLGMIEQRLLNDAETAHYLGISASSFSSKKRELEAKYDFPRRHPLLGRRDRKAIDLWVDRHLGLGTGQTSIDTLVNERLGLLQNGKG